jgi:hypothetical protein
MIVVDEALAGLHHCRLGSRKQIVLKVFPFMFLSVFGITSEQRDNRNDLRSH